MGIQFHETEYGRCFFGKQLSDLIKALNRIAEHMEQAAEETETPDKICVCYQENSRLLAAENGYISDLTATADTAEFQRIIEEWLQSAKDNRYAWASTSEKTEEKDMKKMYFIGIDSWYRAVYKDANENLWKTAAPVKNELIGDNEYINDLGLYDIDDFDGEPGFPLKEEIEVCVNQRK